MHSFEFSCLVLVLLLESIRHHPWGAHITQKWCEYDPNVPLSLPGNAGALGVMINITQKWCKRIKGDALVLFPGDLRCTGGNAWNHLEVFQTSSGQAHFWAQGFCLGFSSRATQLMISKPGFPGLCSSLFICVYNHTFIFFLHDSILGYPYQDPPWPTETTKSHVIPFLKLLKKLSIFYGSSLGNRGKS